MMAKYPAQYRVTLKDQVDHVRNEDGSYKQTDDGDYVTVIGAPLGFANVYDPHTKAFAKRQKTQDEWAYRDGYEKAETGALWRKGRRWEAGKIVEYDEPVPSRLLPRIIDNIPLDGFKIVHSVNRYSTSNKLWRILDPRGFELEITTGNMEILILSGDILKGEIMGQCVWATAKQLERV